MSTNQRMLELIDILNNAAKVYYQGKDEVMSNYEYDELYDELVRLEEQTGITMNNSPTVNVGYETLSKLTKEEHVAPMLSLDKTKSVDELTSWLGDHAGILSLKLDGLSVILTYENGKLVKALTRGNGTIGEVITNNAKMFKNIPHKINYKGRMVVRGEALIKYSDFEVINESLSIEEQYKNPRNLCSGTVRQLNNKIVEERNVNYYVYNLIETDSDFGTFSKKSEILEKIISLGFDVAPYKLVDGSTLSTKVEEFSHEIAEGYDIPSDGLVLTYDNIQYSNSLGRTAKFPKDSIAFKWKDEIAQTTLKDVEWSASRTGLINPVAIFDPVELEGTTVQRASLHNLSIVKELKLGIGDNITVYKANMIIPQIAENLTCSDNLPIPGKCPVCGEDMTILNENGTSFLLCNNKACYAKKIKSFTHFVSRDAMNIDGLSEMTLVKFINMGILHDVCDIFKLKEHVEITGLEGFGDKSFKNLIDSIENAREVQLAAAVFSLGIKGVGLSVAKLICNKFPYALSEFSKLTKEDLVSIDGIGDKLAESFIEYFSNPENADLVKRLEVELCILMPEAIDDNRFEGLTFVITGSLNTFSNRKECQTLIE
nr:NAD-dependent DNA ligase LigA [Eubacterium sp.]